MASSKELVLETLENLNADEFKKFKWYLQQKVDGFPSIPVSRLEHADHTGTVDLMEKSYSSASVTVTEKVLVKMGKNGVAQMLSQRRSELVLEGTFAHYQEKLKSRLMDVNGIVSDTTRNRTNSLFNDSNTEMYITTCDTGLVNMEHEVREINQLQKRVSDKAPTVTCTDIFNGTPELNVPVRRVLTKGVAGIGKTFVTRRFILDWAQGKANNHFKFVFPIPFRELNLVKDQQFSLVELVHLFFPEMREGGIWNFGEFKVVFIFDGLDECSVQLDFHKTEILADITTCTTLDVLLVNLIRGKLLPNARIWVTSRPAAANHVPRECFELVTEIQGFTDTQKDQYFKKQIKIEDHANRILSHVKENRTLYIMCHNPIFCSIAATVLKDILKTSHTKDLPTTQTELYIRFLIVHYQLIKEKYHRESNQAETSKMILALAKLAFEQLEKENLIFNESDITKCGIDIQVAATCSGVLTEVSKMDMVLHEHRVFCFVHLSVQEFFAALHAHHTLVSSRVNLLKKRTWRIREIKPSLTNLHRSAIKRALQSPNGQWDLFLRFLMGLSQKQNQGLLQGLLREKKHNHKNTVKYIHEKIDQKLPAERSLNLFYCLNELNDHSLIEQIQRFAKSGKISTERLSPAQWSALAFILLSSEKDLEEFDLKKYCASEEALLRLLPVVKSSRRALLSQSNLSKRSCEALGSVLGSASCRLTEIDLSDNDLKDCGIQELISAVGPRCRLKVLRLCGCQITEEGCASLASVLRSHLSNLTELDLSYNHPGAEGVRTLSDLQKDPLCSLTHLRVDHCGEERLRPGLKKYYCELIPNTTLAACLEMSQKNRMVTRTDVMSDDNKPKLWCTNPMNDRCYWEVQYGGLITVKVTYKTQEQTTVSKRKKSWRMTFMNHNSVIKNHGRKVRGDGTLALCRLAVFLDWPGGSLTFYVIDSEGLLSPIHTDYVKFTKPVYATFKLKSCGSFIRLCSPDESEQ